MAFPEEQAAQAEVFPEKFGTSGRCLASDWQVLL